MRTVDDSNAVITLHTVFVPTTMDNLTLDNATTTTTSTEQSVHEWGSRNWAVLGLLVLVLLSIMTNGVVMVTVQHSPRLHSMFYYLLSSLAVSDILNALLVMPVAVARTFLGK